MRAAATIEIACSPENVFDTPADMRNESEWNSGVSVAELRSEESCSRGQESRT